MVAYIVFTRERTRNQAELDTYSQKVPASMPGHALTPRAFYGRLEVLEGARSKAWSFSSFPPSTRPWPGTTAPPIARCASIDTKAPIIASSSSKACDAKRHRADPITWEMLI
jgi:hypothetical protein